MMSSMRGAASGGRAPRRGKGQSSNTQYLLIGIIGVAVIVAAVLMLSGGKPKSTRPASSKKSSTSAVSSKKQRSSRRSEFSGQERVSSRDLRRMEKAKRREEARAARSGGSRRGSKRSRSGGTAGARVANYSPSTLRAIITDESGTRMALVGERRLKPGDVLEGRRVTEVGPDAVKVEFRQSEYTVRVGGSIY